MIRQVCCFAGSFDLLDEFHDQESLGAKRTGERSAGNLHAAFDEAGAGNVAWSR
jgi:hypothetical protein